QSVLVEDFLAPRLRGWRHASEVFFALGPIGIGFLPWTPFLPWAAWRGWWRAGGGAARRALPVLVFCVLDYLLRITPLPHRRARYLRPTSPALALMVGWLWDRWTARGELRALRWHAGVWSLFAALIALAVLLPLRARPELAVLIPPTLATKLVLVGLLVAA